MIPTDSQSDIELALSYADRMLPAGEKCGVTPDALRAVMIRRDGTLYANQARTVFALFTDMRETKLGKWLLYAATISPDATISQAASEIKSVLPQPITSHRHKGQCLFNELLDELGTE